MLVRVANPSHRVVVAVVPERFWVNPGCRLVREGSLTFLDNGLVDRTCRAVTKQWIVFDRNGRIDDASVAVRRNEVTFVSSKMALARFREAQTRGLPP